MSVTSLQSYSPEQMKLLVNIARQAITDYFNGVNQPPALDQFDDELTQAGACFVTLEVNHQLQGCLGSIVPHMPLIEDVYSKARSAAYQDHRFSPLQESQTKQLTLEVSVLSPLQRVEFKYEEELQDYLDDNRVGVILSDSGHRAVFLPQVWEQLPHPKQFLRHLKIKGGWPETYWSASMKVDLFSVTCAKEPFVH